MSAPYSHINTDPIETRLPDGRILAHAEWGDPGGDPVIYSHGGPGSRLEGALFHEAAARHRFRLIAVDRPGMGRSTFLPGRTLLDYPKDIIALANALGLDRFGVIGWSGGGAHTSVCAYAIPERLSFCLSLAGYTNWGEYPEAPAMLSFAADRVAVKLAMRWPESLRVFFWMMKLSVRWMPRVLVKSMVEAAGERDRAILADVGFVEHLIADQREAFVQGTRGVTTDALVHYVDWGYRLAETKGKIHIFHGTEDPQVPVEWGRHLADQIPCAVLHELAGEGHLFPMTHQDVLFEMARSELS